MVVLGQYGRTRTVWSCLHKPVHDNQNAELKEATSQWPGKLVHVSVHRTTGVKQIGCVKLGTSDGGK